MQFFFFLNNNVLRSPNLYTKLLIMSPMPYIGLRVEVSKLLKSSMANYTGIYYTETKQFGLVNTHKYNAQVISHRWQKVEGLGGI